MTSRYASAISPRVFTRVLPEASLPPNLEGAGNAGRSVRPQPCVRNSRAHKRSHHGHTGNARHSPRNGFNGLYRALPGDRAFLPPSLHGIALPRNLTPASGRQDHTTLPSAGSAPSSEAPPASIASRPAFVTIASHPSVGQDRTAIVLLLPRRQAIFLKFRNYVRRHREERKRRSNPFFLFAVRWIASLRSQ